MRFALIILMLCGLLSACDYSYHPDSPVTVVDRTLREQYFTECVHSVKDFDTIILDETSFAELKSACRRTAFTKALLRTTYGEYQKHPDWAIQY